MGDSEVIMGLISNDEVTDDDKISLSNPENGCPTGTTMADLAPLLTPMASSASTCANDCPWKEH